MRGSGCVVVVGGTSGLGLEVARRCAKDGRDVVVTGRDADRAAAAAHSVGASGSAAFDLAAPETIAPGLAGVGPVAGLVVAAIERDENTCRDYDVARAMRLVVLKLVGYTEVVHALLDRMDDDSAVVLFGGLALDRPYPGSTTVSTVNGGITGMVHSLAVELAPIRVNAVHPAVVVDSPYWRDKPQALERVRDRTPGRRGVTMADVVEAVAFLLDNPGINGANLRVDGGSLRL